MTAPLTVSRIRSIDTVRGAIMVIMALDHVRDFFHESAFLADPTDVNTTTGILFFTRWITHFCAPSFMLLLGISAYLSGQNKTVAERSSFLIKRGLWLILVDMIFMTFGFTFDIYYKTIILAVLWALGTSMIVLGIFARFTSARVILIVGLIIVIGHNLLDSVKLTENSVSDILLKIFVTGRGTFLPRGDGGTIGFLYVVIPWVGIMMSGYGLGVLYKRDYPAESRKRILLISGLIITVLFFVFRFVNLYGDPAHWAAQATSTKTLISFFNVTKYPPSLIFTLMTQGPLLIALAFTEKSVNALARFFTVYGRVPFFFFMVHFYLIHLLTMIAVLTSGYTWAQATDDQLFFKFRPNDFGYSLGTTYLIWVAIVLALYFPCKWFGEYRVREKKWWLSYL
ncbi:DUF1624 domain-containing protein [Dyadobacter luticola]|uniref:DUF1624 domain-containing protein n=1 Tax=Dyadobacter luticola TaxID=1979387 RepID=A0A5R9L5J0_9BACT|nr:heparan-alpha-glucosaminide N-acetyltransferase domain-containing protein [Dyadobacter luticola]TLV03649.1 DUF1624 domain-containing protein [Dyadobacter luticola]